MTLGGSELVTGLGLLLILALAGSAAVVLRWRREVSRSAAAVELNDGGTRQLDRGGGGLGRGRTPRRSDSCWSVFWNPWATA